MTHGASGPGVASGLEVKFCRFGEEIAVDDDLTISGYASLFGQADQGGDVVVQGAYAASLKALRDAGRSVKMLWQHDPGTPIGYWEEIREDDRGLWVKGRLLEDVAKGREAAHLIAAGAIDGLSIGYRTKKASKDSAGRRRLEEVELWEVSLVTFPMLAEARVEAKSDALDGALSALTEALRNARAFLSGPIME